MDRFPILAALCILPTGCAGMIAKSGIDLDAFESVNEVHSKFGEPCVKGSATDLAKGEQSIPKNQAFYEDYHTRLKISDRDWTHGDGYAMALSVTLGTVELLLVPEQLYYLTKHAITGQTLRIIYDSNGKVVAGELDGKPLYLDPHYHTTSKEKSPSLPPPSSMSPTTAETTR
jgi:hypothetical protein